MDRFILRTKVGSVGDGLHRLLKGLTDRWFESIEKHGRVSIYVFLNRMLAMKPKRKRPRSYVGGMP